MKWTTLYTYDIIRCTCEYSKYIKLWISVPPEKKSTHPTAAIRRIYSVRFLRSAKFDTKSHVVLRWRGALYLELARVWRAILYTLYYYFFYIIILYYYVVTCAGLVPKTRIRISELPVVYLTLHLNNNILTKTTYNYLYIYYNISISTDLYFFFLHGCMYLYLNCV